MKRINHKHRYLTIGAADMLLFILPHAYLTWDWADFLYSHFSSVLKLRKISALKSGNKITKSENYSPSVCKNVIAGVVVTLLSARIPASFALRLI